jgi:hypothetical protein
MVPVVPVLPPAGQASSPGPLSRGGALPPGEGGRGRGLSPPARGFPFRGSRSQG